MALTSGWECPICHAGVSPMCMRCPCRNEVKLKDADSKLMDFDAMKAAVRSNPTSPHGELKTDPFGHGRMAPAQFTDGLGRAGVTR